MDAHEIRNLSALVEATKRADDMRFHEQANSSLDPRENKCRAVPVVVNSSLDPRKNKCRAVPVVVFERYAQNFKEML